MFKRSSQKIQDLQAKLYFVLIIQVKVWTYESESLVAFKSEWSGLTLTSFLQ